VWWGFNNHFTANVLQSMQVKEFEDQTIFCDIILKLHGLLIITQLGHISKARPSTCCAEGLNWTVASVRRRLAQSVSILLLVLALRLGSIVVKEFS